MKLIPSGHRLILLLDEVREKMYKGTIVLPDKHGERSRLATVIAVGNGYVNDYDGTKRPLKYKKNDRVLVSWYCGTEIHLPDRDMPTGCYRCVPEAEIMMRVSEEDKPEIEGEDEGE